jgi:hypothetical protein
VHDVADPLAAALDTIADERRDLPHGDWLDVERRARGRRPRRRSARVVLFAAALAVGVGTAVAAGTGAFDGISAANHPKTTRDELTARQRALLQPPHFQGITITGARLTQIRLLEVLPDRWKLFAAPGAGGGVCALLVAPSRRSSTTSCGPQLEPTYPITVAVTNLGPPGRAGSILFGIARDGVRSITVTVDGRRRAVAVRGNAYYLIVGRTQHIDIRHVSVTFAGGRRLELS